MSTHESQEVRDHIDALQRQVTELKQSVEQARQETSEKITARVEQVKESLNQQSDSASGSGQGDGRPQSQWQTMKAQAAAKTRDLHDHLERKRGEVRADVADDDAISAEGAAVDALDFAAWAVRQAELSVLDAIDARARADERAAAAGR
jgi:chromosome segregation ATPase